MTAPAPLYHYYYFYTRRRGITKHWRGNKFILTLMGQVHFNSLLFRILKLKKFPTLGIIAWCQRVWVILCHFLRRAICDVCRRDTRCCHLLSPVPIKFLNLHPNFSLAGPVFFVCGIFFWWLFVITLVDYMSSGNLVWYNNTATVMQSGSTFPAWVIVCIRAREYPLQPLLYRVKRSNPTRFQEDI